MRSRQLPGPLQCLVLAAVICTAAPFAQSAQERPSDEAQTTFRATTDVVVLHVNVFDRRSDAVPGLPQGVFHVLEDGVRQTIAFFNSADVPVAVGLILDNSGSMIARSHMVLAGGAAFARAARPGDELFTIHFNEQVQFGLPEAVPFTSLASLVHAALSRYHPAGKTALHDAVMAGLRHLDRAANQKRVLVVLSDGDDNASRHSEDEMMARARASDAIVYTVSNANRRIGFAGDPGLLRTLANVTGGVAYFPGTDERVIEDLDEIAGNIRRGYTIGYVSSNPARDGTFRTVKVMALVPGRTGLAVRTREGYTAPVP